LSGYPDDIDLLARVEPEYREFTGWKMALRACRRYEDLPTSARELVELVERFTGVPVSMIGVGPERDECVVRA
jgi:adenylosuccinate synthase